MFANVFNHPKTSAAGVLVCILTVAGVLSQQGITLGHAGTGTVVALIGALAAALLGLVAKDPGSGATVTSISGSQKLSALLLIALLIPLPLMQGCTTSASQLRADGTVLVTALNNLAAAVQVSDPNTAIKLNQAAQVIQAAVNSSASGVAWQQALNAASGAAEVILAAIPSTSAYAPLVAIAVAATEAIIVNTAPAPAATRAMAEPVRMNVLLYRTRGQNLIEHRFARTVKGDYIAAWNAAARKANVPEAALR